MSLLLLYCCLYYWYLLKAVAYYPEARVDNRQERLRLTKAINLRVISIDKAGLSVLNAGVSFDVFHCLRWVSYLTLTHEFLYLMRRIFAFDL